MGMLFRVSGLQFPRSCCSHSSRLLSQAGAAGSFGDGGLLVSLLTAVETGLHAVWNASGGGSSMLGNGVNLCAEYREKGLSPLGITIAADQFLLLDHRVFKDSSLQTFIRRVLHHLIRVSGSLLASHVRQPVVFSSTSWGAWSLHQDMLVQLQCTLMMFEGLLASSTTLLSTRTNAG